MSDREHRTSEKSIEPERDGKLEQRPDGRWQLRFARKLAYDQATIWRAITEPDRLAAWFPTTIEGERTAGAPLRFGFPHGEAPDFEGEMLAFEPEELIEFRWGPDLIRIELRERDGGTELTLLDALGELGKAARDGAGWHTCLDALDVSLGGPGEDSRRDVDRWREVHSRYVESFGPDASSIGPPDGFERG